MDIVLMLSQGPEDGTILSTSDTSSMTIMLDRKVLLDWNRDR